MREDWVRSDAQGKVHSEPSLQQERDPLETGGSKAVWLQRALAHRLADPRYLSL